MLATGTEIVQGRRLRVARLGEGPPLLLLHGYPDNLQIFSALAPLLAPRFKVVAFDWPGMGESETWPGGATPQAMADRLAALCDHWKLERAHLAGTDMGGQPALVFAARHGSRCASVAVMNSLVVADAETSWEIALLRRFGANRLLLRHLPALVFRRAERTFGAPLSEDLREDLWRSFRRLEVRDYIVRMCAGFQGTLPSLPYAEIARPVLILWGALDKHFPPVQAERLHELLPDSLLEVLPGAPHWMVLSHAPLVAERLAAFFSSRG